MTFHQHSQRPNDDPILWTSFNIVNSSLLACWMKFNEHQQVESLWRSCRVPTDRQFTRYFYTECSVEAHFSASHSAREESEKSGAELKIKTEMFSHLFQSIFYRALVPCMNDFRLNYAVLIKINRIWNENWWGKSWDWNIRTLVFDFFSLRVCNLRRITPRRRVKALWLFMFPRKLKEIKYDFVCIRTRESFIRHHNKNLKTHHQRPRVGGSSHNSRHLT